MQSMFSIITPMLLIRKIFKYTVYVPKVSFLCNLLRITGTNLTKKRIKPV